MNLRKTCPLLLAGALLVVMAGCRNHRYFDDGVTAAGSDSGEVNISKMGGGIDVEDAPQGATLTTMGGGIHLGNVARIRQSQDHGRRHRHRSRHRHS